MKWTNQAVRTSGGLVSPISRRRLAVTAALIAIVALRLLLQRELYRSGFEVIEGDEFLRTVKAAWWTRDPGLFLHRDQLINWLPLPICLTGIALKIHWNILFVPRGINVVLGAASLALMYFLARSLFDSPRAGLISALLLAVNPAHVWLSSTGLSEILYSALLLAFLLCFTLHLQRNDPLSLVLASLFLALANATRYEGWAVSGVFSAFLVAGSARRTIRIRSFSARAAGELAAAGLPWIFPAAWLIFNHHLTGKSVSFISNITAGVALADHLPTYGPYVQAALTIDPWLAFLGIPAWIFVLFHRSAGRAARGYAALLFLPMAAVVVLRGGGAMAWPTVYIRYLSTFFFLAYPALAWTLDWGTGCFFRNPAVRGGVLGAGLILIVVAQAHRIFRFHDLHPPAGVKVGEMIARIRASASCPDSGRFLIEDPGEEEPGAGWQIFAIMVGSGDAFSSGLIWHREKTARFSLKQSNIAELNNYLKRREVRYIAVKSPALRGAAESRLGLKPEKDIGGYFFYPCPASGDPSPAVITESRR